MNVWSPCRTVNAVPAGTPVFDGPGLAVDAGGVTVAGGEDGDDAGGTADVVLGFEVVADEVAGLVADERVVDVDVVADAGVLVGVRDEGVREGNALVGIATA